MIEKEFLKLLIMSTDNISMSITSNFKAEYLDLDVTGFSPIRELYITVSAFFSKYRTVIPSEQLESFLVTRTYDSEKIKKILVVYDELSVIATDKNFDFLLQELKRTASLRILRVQLDKGVDAILGNDLTKALEVIKSGINKSELVLKSEISEGSISDSVFDIVKRYKDAKHKRSVPGLSTGFRTVDELTGGLKSGELDIIMSGSNEGKSTFMLNVGYHVQDILNKNVLFVSVELPKQQIEERYVALSSGLNINKIQRGTLDEEEEKLFKAALIKIHRHKPYFQIVDTPACTANIIAAKITEMSVTVPVDLVIVDYLTIVKPSVPTSQGWENMSNVALELRDLARVYKVPVLTAMQVKQGSMKNKKDLVYNMTDAALSFPVIYHADTVMTLKNANPDILQMGVSICELNASITKCRNGQKGNFIIDAAFARMKMQERENGHSVSS